MKPRVLLTGLAMVESPRWHEGRLWFSHWGMEEFIAVDPAGGSEVVAKGPPRLGWATDWLPDGRRLTTGQELMCTEPDGREVRHADLSELCPHGCSEIVVDGRGNVYVNSINFDFIGGGKPEGGLIVLITPGGDARKVADDLAFPNGMVVTPDNRMLIVSESFARQLTAFDIADDGALSNRRTWAKGDFGPDGITLDAEGAIWTSNGETTGVRLAEGGKVLDSFEHDRPLFAFMLGGPDRRTLYVMAAQWFGTDKVDDLLAARSGQVLALDAPAPGVGWP